MDLGDHFRDPYICVWHHNAEKALGMILHKTFASAGPGLHEQQVACYQGLVNRGCGGETFLINDVLVLPLDCVGRTWSIPRVEPTLSKVRGVHQVSVNMATEKVRIAFDPVSVSLQSLVQVVRSCGCDVRTKQATIRVRGINCSSCAKHTEAALLKIPGVVDAWVDVATRSAIVSYLAGHTTPDRLSQAIRCAGYEPGDIATSDSDRLMPAGRSVDWGP